MVSGGAGTSASVRTACVPVKKIGDGLSGRTIICARTAGSPTFGTGFVQIPRG
jgi:hypothetical protein